MMVKKKQTLLLGAHMSIADGIYLSIQRGKSIDCTAIQIFTKSNRQWSAKKLSQNDIDLFKEHRKRSSIKSIIAHASYLINLGSPKKEVEEKSISSLKEELRRCDILSIPYLVLHPGSSLKTDEPSCINRISNNLNKICATTSGKTMILLETMAGQGSSICYKFEQIAKIYQQSTFKHRIGVCFDTCHVFVAGYDFRTKKTYEALWQAFNQIIGIKHLKAIHINDSKKNLGARVDRHADIGKGKLGLNAFRLLFNDKRFFDIPKILETPKENLEDDLRNMNTIKKLLSPKTRQLLQTH